MLHKHENQRDRLIAYLANQKSGDDRNLVVLTAADQRKLDNLLEMAALIREHKVQRKSIDLYMGRTGRSQSQAYADYHEAQAIVGSVTRVAKDFQRSLYIDACWEVYAKAMAKGDYRSANGALGNLKVGLGLDKEDVNLPDYSRFQPPPQRFGWFPDKVARNLPPDNKLIPLLKKLAGEGKNLKLHFDFEAFEPNADDRESD